MKMRYEKQKTNYKKQVSLRCTQKEEDDYQSYTANIQHVVKWDLVRKHHAVLIRIVTLDAALKC